MSGVKCPETSGCGWWRRGDLLLAQIMRIARVCVYERESCKLSNAISTRHAPADSDQFLTTSRLPKKNKRSA